MFRLATASLAFILALPCLGAAQASSSKARPAPPRPATAGRASAAFERLVEDAAKAREEQRLADAAELLERALKLRPAWIDGWGLLGTVYYDVERYAEARDAFRRVLAAQQKNAIAWAFKGLCEYQLKNHDRALSDLDRSRTLGLTTQPQIDRTVRYHLGILWARFGQYESSYIVLGEFAREGQDNPMLVEALGIAMLRMPYLPAELPAEKREMVLMAGRAGIYGILGRDETARRAFDELVARYPETPNVHYAYGVYLLRPDANAAVTEFRRELALSPTHVQAMLQIAFEHLSRGEIQSALPLARQAVDLAPTYYVARLALGRCHLESGAVTEAVAELEEGVRLMDKSPELRLYLWRAYEKAGRTQDAARQRAEMARLERERGETTPVLVGVRPEGSDAKREGGEGETGSTGR